MKLLLTLIIFSLSMTVSPIQAQGIFESIKKTAAMDDERRGETSNENSGYSEDDMDRFNKWWEEKLNDQADFLNELDEPNYHCMALISLYMFHFNELAKETTEEENCKMKYDLYGMQSLMIFSGTTIMPCTEEIYNLDRESKSKLVSGFLQKFVETCNDRAIAWTDFAEEHPRTSSKIILGFIGEDYCTNYHRENLAAYRPYAYINMALEAYFHPESITKQLIHISKEMEALGCGG